MYFRALSDVFVILFVDFSGSIKQNAIIVFIFLAHLQLFLFIVF